MSQNTENSISTKWVVFDVMGVIFEVGDDTNELLIPFLQKRNAALSSEKINEVYLRASLGEISSFAFWDELGFSSEYPDIERNYLDSCLTIDPEFSEIAHQLKQTYSLAILSNDIKEWSEYLRAKFGLYDFFKTIIISGEVGRRKPDKQIYSILVNRIQSVPQNCVFIDDRLRNLRPASKLGMKTIYFNRETARADTSADAEIKCFKELPQAIERIFAGNEKGS